MMKIKSVVLICVLMGSTVLHAQQFIEQRQLIDLPTAGTLDRGSYDIRLRMFGNGGLVGGVSVGVTPRFMFGLSWGGTNIIGEGDVDWNPNPGIHARIRLLDENFAIPAITLGFDSQGYGAYNDGFDRFENKSRGFFAVASKNYAVLFNLGLHGGLNFSLEDGDDDEDLNLFLGVDLSFNREFRAILEYDFANNDNENDARFGGNDGYLNGGVQWIFSEQLILQFNIKNLLKSGANEVTREFKIGYFEYF
ncbi:MAG: hypothetical protein ACE5IY_18010 [bacterium]